MDFEKHTYTDRVVTYVKECILKGTYKPAKCMASVFVPLGFSPHPLSSHLKEVAPMVSKHQKFELVVSNESFLEALVQYHYTRSGICREKKV